MHEIWKDLIKKGNLLEAVTYGYGDRIRKEKGHRRRVTFYEFITIRLTQPLRLSFGRPKTVSLLQQRHVPLDDNVLVAKRPARTKHPCLALHWYNIPICPNKLSTIEVAIPIKINRFFNTKLKVIF